MSGAAVTVNSSRPWIDDETLSTVRPTVRNLLAGSSTFAGLPPEEQRALAQDLVQVSSYLVNPEGLVTGSGNRPLAAAQADNVERAGGDATSTTTAGQEFRAAAVRQGTEQFGRLVQTVDFPSFVGGLITNVFEAIVDSSIKQMRAYGELLANVAKTVDEFAVDNISENNTRDWLANKYPDVLEVQTSGRAAALAEGDAPPVEAPKLVTKGDDPSAGLATIGKDLGMEKPPGDLADEVTEAELVRRARLQIARQRQQLLSSMVLLGINRIVVTDGLINAKVVFDMKASDRVTRTNKASLYDSDSIKSRTQASTGASAWFSPVSANFSSEVATDHVTTVQSSVDDTSDSRAEVKAKLTGEVRVNFKSDYLPMDKMATPQMIAAIQGNAQPVEKPVTGA